MEGNERVSFSFLLVEFWRVEDSERYVGEANMSCVIGMGDIANRERKMSKKSRK